MEIIAEFALETSRLLYRKEGRQVGMLLVPSDRSDLFVNECAVEPLVQLHVRGDRLPGGFANGLTLRGSGTVAQMEFCGQTVRRGEIVSFFRDGREFETEHHCTLQKDSVSVFSVFRNRSMRPVRLDMISSFALGGLSPYKKDDTSGLKVHRLASFWSAEGKLVSQSAEQLMLEKAWNPFAVRSEKFGSLGSMPVRRYFPFVAVEDGQAGVVWGAQLYHNASWQIELSCFDSGLSVSGGIADREFGHWSVQVGQGQAFTSPRAVLAVSTKGLDGVCNQLVAAQSLAHIPEIERDLPVSFNEWCSSWGSPSEQNVQAAAKALRGKGVTYFTIDAGWFREDEKTQSGWDTAGGDWLVSSWLFPNGIGRAADIIRENGMIPGIWFEYEAVGGSSQIYNQKDWLLKRDGVVIDTGRRAFLDLRNREVEAYLDARVIQFLKDNRFGYLKVDYNDSIGIGCDGEESMGENLRLNQEASRRYFQKITAQLPELVLESCSSGGHRCEPSVLESVSQSSFSDAHEGKEIPIIAANLHRVMHPCQSQIWAVLHAEDSCERLYYSLVNTFLGRMCLSGDVVGLHSEQWEIIERAISFYKKIACIISDGNSYRYGNVPESFLRLQGNQVVLREGKAMVLIIAHSFELRETDREVPLQGAYEVTDRFGSEKINLAENKILFGGDFCACAFLCKKRMQERGAKAQDAL